MKWLRPAWKSQCERRAVRAVARLTEPQELLEAALHSPRQRARLAAVQRLGDDALLRILRDPRGGTVHEAAVRCMRDTHKLIPYAKGGSSIPARCRALSRIGDADTLRAVILTDPCGWVRETAMKHLADAQFLADVALGLGSLDIPARVCAARHITQEAAAMRVREAVQAGSFGEYADACLDALTEGIPASVVR